MEVKIHCYLATKSEVEGFRDQSFVLPEVESLRVHSLWLLKKALSSRVELLTLYERLKRGSALNIHVALVLVC